MKDWKVVVFHGFTLFLILATLHIPLSLFFGPLVLARTSGLPGAILFMIFAFLMYPIADGLIAKGVGSAFVDDESSKGYFPTVNRPEDVEREAGPLTKCPYCEELFPYRDDHLSEDGIATCQHCGASIKDPRYE
jgi:hypothetical protein